MTSALYLTADLTCHLKYRTLVVLLILIYFASLRYEQALPSQHARLLFTPSLHRGSTTGTLYCVASPTASCTGVSLRIRRGDRRSMTAVLQQLHWMPVKYRIEYKLLVIVFRALHDRTPAYLASLITPYVPRRALRSADRALLTVPRHNLEHYGRRSFSRAGPTLWNSLLEDLRLTGCLETLKARLKTHYFKLTFNV